MKRRIALFIFWVCAAASSAFGQGRTIVSGTVTDSSGLKYVGASLTATLTTPAGTSGAYLNGVQINGSVGPVQLDSTGSFLMALADNTLVQCANAVGQIGACAPQTQWSFAITLSPGVAPPVGTGPQTCSATLTISGSSQSVSASFSSCPALSNVSGGGAATPNTINPTQAPYNAPVTNLCVVGIGLTIASGSNQVVCTTTTFTAADIGKVAWYSCCQGLGGQNKSTSGLVLAQGFIHDVVNSTTVHICTTSSGACTPVNATANGATGGIFYYGFKATSQLAAAVAAAYAGPGACPVITWSGWLMVDTPIGNQLANCGIPIGAIADKGVSIDGKGRQTTVLLGSPDFNYSGASLGIGNSVFFGVQGASRRNFGINGGGVSGTATRAAPGSGTALLSCQTDDDDWNVGISDWGGQDPNLIGYSMNGCGAYDEYVEVDGAGGQAPISIVGGQWNTLTNGYAADVKGANSPSANAGCMLVGAGAVTTVGFYFGAASSTGSVNCVSVQPGAIWISKGDKCLTGSGTNCIANVGGTIHLSGFHVTNVGGLVPDHGIFSNAAGAKTFIDTSEILGTVNPVLNSSGTVFVDEHTDFGGGGTNSGLAPTCAVTGAGTGATCNLTTGFVSNERGGFSITAGTTPGASGTITLTFAGSGFTILNTNPFQVCNFRFSNAGTGAWNARASFIDPGQGVVTAYPVTWDNNGVALTAASTYFFNYTCQPK